MSAQGRSLYSSASPERHVSYRFGSFTFDAATGELAREGRPQPLEPKVSSVLSYLLAHSDRTVSKPELLSKVWDGVTIADSTLHRCISLVRKALGDDGQKRRFVVTVGRAGYRFTARVTRWESTTANTKPAVQREQTGRSRPLVGRTGELRIAEVAVQDLQETSAGNAIAVVGEAGIGKTRFLDAVVERYSEAGLLVLRAACARRPAGIPMVPWQSIVNGLLPTDAFKESVNKNLLAARAASLCLPAIGDVIAEFHSPSPRRAEPTAADIERSIQGLKVLLLDFANRRPSAIVIDDAHWADSATIAVLQELGSEIRTTALITVAAYRPADLDAQPSLASLDSQAATRGDHQRIELPPFNVDEVMEFSRSIEPKCPNDVARRIYERSQGNPFFAQELTQYLTRALADEATGAAHSVTQLRLLERSLEVASSAIPPGIRTVVEARLGEIDEGMNDLLKWVAVYGRPIETADLIELFGDSSERLYEAIDDAVAAGILVSERQRARSIDFAHVLLRDVVYESIGPMQRMHRHKAIADRIAKRRAANDEQNLRLLADHYLAAAPIGCAEPALRYSSAAAQAAMSKGAFRTAAECFSNQLEAHLVLGELGDLDQYDLVMRIGDAYEKAGEDPQARAAFWRAAELVRGTDLAEEFAVAALGAAIRFNQPVAAEPLADDEQALLREALDGLPEQSSRERALLSAALCFVNAGGSHADLCIPLSSASELAAAASRDPYARHVAMAAKHTALLRPDTYEMAMSVREDLIESARCSNSHDIQLIAETYAVLAGIECGTDIVELHAAMDRHRELVEQAGDSPSRWWMHVAAATRAILAADWNGATAAIERARREGQRSANPNQHIADLTQRSQVLLHTGDFAGLLDLSNATRTRYQHIAGTEIAHVSLRAAFGDLDPAKIAAEKWAKKDLNVELTELSWLFHACCLGELAYRTAHEGLARRVTNFLDPFRRQNAVIGMSYQGPVARYRAVAMTVFADQEEVEAEFELALARTEALSATAYAATTEIAFGEYLKSIGEQTRAQELFGSARVRAESCGADGVATMVALAEAQTG